MEVAYGDVKGFIHLQDLESFKTSLDDFSPEQEVNLGFNKRQNEFYCWIFFLSQLEACVISIDSTTKMVHFSLQQHILSLNESPSILKHIVTSSTDAEHQALLGSVQSCIVLKNIGSSLAIRLPKFNQFGIVASTHLTDEKDQDLQQVLNSFQSNQKKQLS